jgi:poly(hydroxyalkanoate) granule-associated protein
MAKKLKKATKSNGKLTDGVLASAQQIWQAGLDVLAKTQQEGERVLAKLSKEGSSTASDVSQGLTKLSNSVGKQASDSWDKLEQLIEKSVKRSVANLGLSTQKELLAVHKRIDSLTNSTTKPAAKKTGAKKKAAPKKKAAAKKAAPAKKAVAKKAAVKSAAAKKPAARKSSRSASASAK